MGLHAQYCVMIDRAMKDKPELKINQAKEDAKTIFDYILKCSGIEKIKEPIQYEDLWDPESKIVCLILYLYTIEPPFYAEINKAVRLRDK